MLLLFNRINAHSTEIYLLTLLYTKKLEEGSLDVDGYVKSIDAIWKRLNDVNQELPEEPVVFMTLMGLPPSFGTQRRILESRKDLSMDIIKKDLRQEVDPRQTNNEGM